ncbi:MAG: tRNA lysidine(34) synthetase TilS [Steroidobacteraceae bacterium]
MARPDALTPASLESRLATWIPTYPDCSLIVALSGGLDSTVLADLLLQLAAVRPDLRLRAVHVDHGLQEVAGEWALRCARWCEQRGLPLQVLRLHLGAVPPGHSLEAYARDHRRAALAGLLKEDDVLLTAHHLDDQSETVLMQLLRGAGLRGLAAMPVRARLGRGWQLRPLLDFNRLQLHHYAAARSLLGIEDPMNADPRFDRAFLRQSVLPVMDQRWPSAARTLARSAAHLAEAQGLLDELAALDARGLLEAGCLSVSGLKELDASRQRNLLRWWLHASGLPLPSTRRLESILRDVLGASEGRSPVVRWPGGEVRRHGDRLFAQAPMAPPLTGPVSIAPGEDLDLPGLSIRLAVCEGAGIALESPDEALELRFGHMDERLAWAPERRPSRVRDLLREQGIPPWLRPRFPLIYRGADLLAVGPVVGFKYRPAAGRLAVRPEIRWQTPIL